jgi:hypothetical protein
MNDAASEQIEKVGIPRKQMFLEITYSICIYIYISLIVHVGSVGLYRYG